MIFDGRAFASEIEEQIKVKVSKMVKKPKIVSVIVGDDPSSLLYTKLKKQTAERVGIEFEILKLDLGFKINDLRNKIQEIGVREDVSGVMVQLPLPEALSGETSKLLEAIPLGKDVDGLRWEESGIKPATVRAILAILDKIAGDPSATLRTSPDLWRARFVVVGARGAVGGPLVHFLREQGIEVSEVEWDTVTPADIIGRGEVVISCVGKAGIVTAEMVREGAIAIDVGMSQVGGKVVGDMTQEVYQKAGVAVPVPGGVGPVTIASLMANVMDLVL